MNIEEILIIKNGSAYYGINIENIDQILRVPAITPVVLSSPTILGLSSVSGKIVTVYDINMLLDTQKIDIHSDEARLLSLTQQNRASSLIVSEVSDTIELDQSMLEYIEDNGDGVIAFYRHENNIIQILDITALLRKATLDEYEKESIKDGSLKNADEKSDNVQTKRYLFIKMANERYALNIDSLREIMKLPSEFTEITGSSDEVLGMMALRGELLVIVDLRRFFCFDDKIVDKNRILVTEVGGHTLGLVVDEILDIRDIDAKHIDEMPSNFRDKKISGVIHDNRQLISLIGEDVIEMLAKYTSTLMDSSERSMESDGEKAVEFEVVSFKFSDEEYAIDIENVVEIIDAVDATPFADSPPYVEGIINIRGQIVMMMSVYEWLSKPKPTSDEQKIIICQIDDYRIGFYVDSISDVMGIEKDEIKQERDDSEHFSHILHLEDGKRLVLLFDINKIAGNKEVA
jgi:purine-binding chemotaxis protein CheW